MDIFDFLNKNFFIKDHLNLFYLKIFRKKATEMFQVWKRGNNFYVATDVINYCDDLYAKLTIDFGDDLTAAKKHCDELRRNYILTETKKRKMQKTIY